MHSLSQSPRSIPYSSHPAQQSTDVLLDLHSQLNAYRIAAKEYSQKESMHRFLATIHQMLPNPLLVVTADGWIVDSNPAAARFVNGGDGKMPTQVSHFWPDFMAVVTSAKALMGPVETRWKTPDGEKTVLATIAPQTEPDESEALAYVCVASDLTERKKLEIELREAQKLESLGQLAAGVAHEINTPMQFIGDNLNFIRDVLTDLLPLLTKCTQPSSPAELRDHASDIDLDFIMARAPGAVERALEGVGRVSEIVSAMRSFAHPDRARSPQDVNNIIKTSLVLAKNEYKYVAAVATDLGAVPAIDGNLPDLSQMFVNLIVNAAHAIEDRFGRDANAGHISITTQTLGDRVRICIRDNGCGIPEEIRHKIFDPFFTTKEVGRGTGQGLSIVHNVVQRHQGKIQLESEVGSGTTFIIELPVETVESLRTQRTSLTTGGNLWR